MNVERRKHVCLMLGWYSDRTHHAIIRYAYRANWILNDTMFYGGLPRIGEDLDGAIISYAGRHEILEVIRSRECLAVEIGQPPSPLNLPRVGFDDMEIGRQAARHLIEKGLQTIGYVFEHDDGHPRDQLRSEGVREEVSRHDKLYKEFLLPKIERQLSPVTFPIGLVVQNDRVAFDLLGRLQAMGVQVPHQAALIGVDNAPSYCELAEIGLSSVDPSAEERALQACRLLGRLMDGASPPRDPILVEPKGVVERLSTQTMGIEHGPTAKAYSILSVHFLDPELTPDHLAKQVGITRCQLDKRFNRHIGRSVSAEILRLRLNYVHRLLSTTELKIYEIAEAAAFGSPEYLAVAFRKAFGHSPRAHRASIRTPPP